MRTQRTVVRAMFGLVIGGLAAASVAVSPAGADPVVTTPAPIVASTAPTPAPPPAPVRTTEPARPAAGTATLSATPKPRRTTKPTTTTRRATSCAERAMQAGRFDPSCPQYQGYLDPGTAAGREPTSGETQMQYACEQGLVPRSQCD